jgi:hypothetical protein
MKYAARPDINKILDVGTWNGKGTTLCLVTGACMKGDVSRVSIVSVEANKELYGVACKTWETKPPFLHLLYGTLSKDIMKPHEVTKHPLFEKVKEHYQMHYTRDCCNIINAPEIDFQHAVVDLAVLDGGEFCGESDFRCCMGVRPRVIALDDINVMKNSNNYAWLLKNNMKWELKESGEDRNGWAIFERKKNHALEEILKQYHEKYGK